MKLFYKIVLFVLGINYQTLSYSQNWTPMGSGTDFYARILYTDTIDNLLYLGGGFKTVDGDTARGITSWNGTKWDSLGRGIDDIPFSSPLPVMSICRYKNDLYVGGAFQKAGNVWANKIAKWDGIKWDSLPNNVNGNVTGMVEYNNLLYVVGWFDTVGTTYSPSIATWDGTQWNAFPVTPPFTNIDCIIFYNNELYVGGNFAAGQFSSIARFDGTQWLPVGSGFVGSLSWVNCFEVYQNELYIGGLFFKSDGNVEDHLAKWDGVTLSSIGGAGGNSNPQVSDLITYKNELYAVGVFNTIGGVPADRIAKWDGSQWCGLGTSFDNNILTTAIYNDSLIIGGGFDTINTTPIKDIAQWTGGNYTDTCNVYVGINDIENVSNEVTIYPNPTTGNFTIDIENFVKVHLEIYNLSGQLILQRLLDNNTTQVNLTDYSKGIYLVKIIADNQVTVKKIFYQ